MPVYLLQQAEAKRETDGDIEQKQQQLEKELDTYSAADKLRVSRLKMFLSDVNVWHVSEMDYLLRIEFEKYLLQSGLSFVSIKRYLKTYDKIKQCEIAEQRQTLAGKRRYEWKYQNAVLYLRYHPDTQIAQEFNSVRQDEALIWDFSRKCSEVLKRQIFCTLNHVIEEVTNLVMRRNKLLALKCFYNFCASQEITDVGLLELEHLNLFQTIIKKQGAQAETRYMSIVNFCRKHAFVEAAKIQWNAAVWYLERFHLTKERMDESKSLESISFMEVRRKENREILQAYMKYELGVTGQAISTIVHRFIFIRNFLEFLECNEMLAIECTASEIEKYANILLERQIQPKGYNERLSGIGHFFKFMEVRKYIIRIPFHVEYFMQKTVRVHHERSVEYEIYMEILNKLYRFPEHLRCMFLHLWCLGLRVSEICMLKGNAYDRQGNDCWIQVYQVKMKTYKRIPMPEGLYRVMEVYLKKYHIQPEDYIFTNTKGGPCLCQTFRFQMLKACAENEIKNGNYIFKSHDYRHTVATMFYDNHVSIQSIRDYLGHTYEEMTRQYIDYMPQRIAAANDDFFSIQGNSLASQLKKETGYGK
ncbi:MAG: phage integrase family protein [Dorea sp.]|nr:phage integrase family protein [Dorea sp.]